MVTELTTSVTHRFGRRCVARYTHGVVAAAALKSVLVADDIDRHSKYLATVRAGHVRKLHLDLRETEADTEEVVEQVLGFASRNLKLVRDEIARQEGVPGGSSLPASPPLPLVRCSLPPAAKALRLQPLRPTWLRPSKS